MEWGASDIIIVMMYSDSIFLHTRFIYTMKNSVAVALELVNANV